MKPTLQGNKVSLRQSSIKKDAPNQCSSNNNLFKYFKAIVAAAMPCGCSAVLRSLSHFSLLLPAFGQLLWPAPNFAHCFLRSASFRFIHYPDNCLRSPVPQPVHKAMLQRHIGCFSKPLSITLHFVHYVIHSLQSGAVHPLPSVVVLALRPPAALRGDVGTAPTLISLSAYATRCPFTVCPSQPAVALLATPAGGTRSPFRRASSIPFDGGQPGFVWTSVPHS